MSVWEVPLTFTVEVGYTTSRPIVVDEFFSKVIVQAITDHDALDKAMAMVMGHKEVEMVTSANIVGVAA